MENRNTFVQCEGKNYPVYVLKEILKSVKLDENLKKENNAILHAFLDSFIDEMKKNDLLFKSVYQRPYFTGSYYIDLRISQPDEFDINIVLKLPFKAEDFEITHQLQTPSYVKYHLKDPEKAAKEHPGLLALLFKDGYLIPENVRKWLQSLVDKTLLNYQPPSQCKQHYRNKNRSKNNGNWRNDRSRSNYMNKNNYRSKNEGNWRNDRNLSNHMNGNNYRSKNNGNWRNDRNRPNCMNGNNYNNASNSKTESNDGKVIYRSENYYRRRIKNVISKQCGPARTILLKKKSGDQIDIDLVPVIESTLDLPTTNLDRRISGKYGNELQAFLVPKPYSSKKQMPINKTEAIRLWRTHFPDTEKAIINDIGCVKPIIKLLKLLRDKEDWKVLASYYLKTLVMWMILDNPDKDYWKEDKMFERFLEALQKLSVCMEQKKIAYFFNKKYNLISKINPEQASNIHNRLKHFIRIFREEPRRMREVFQVKCVSQASSY